MKRMCGKIEDKRNILKDKHGKSVIGEGGEKNCKFGIFNFLHRRSMANLFWNDAIIEEAVRVI